MKKYILLVFLFIPCFCLLGWTIFLNSTRNTGTDIKVSVAGYDPVELLAGHYISYQIDWENTDCNQFPNKVCPKNNFCKENKWNRGTRQCRFYVPEKDAKSLDELLRNQTKNNVKFEVLYSYKKGHAPIAKQLLINGHDWHKYPIEDFKISRN